MTADGYTSNPPSGGGEGGGPVAISDVTGLTAALAGKASTVHTHVAADVTDSTSVGRSVLTAADATAGRTAIGAEPFGAALAAVAGHVEAADPHTQYALETDLTAALALKAPLASPALTGNPTAPTQTAGNNSTRVATTAYVETAVAAGGGGGGGTAPTFSRAYVTTGDIAVPNDAGWTPVSGLSLAIPAAVGDDLEVFLNCMLHSGGGADNFYDLVVLVGGSIVRAASTGTASPATEGDPALYPSTNVLFRGSTTSFGFTAVSGDISGGNVTIGLAHKGPGGGTPKVYASTSYPLRWRIRNDH